MQNVSSVVLRGMRCNRRALPALRSVSCHSASLKPDLKPSSANRNRLFLESGCGGCSGYSTSWWVLSALRVWQQKAALAAARLLEGAVLIRAMAANKSPRDA